MSSAIGKYIEGDRSQKTKTERRDQMNKLITKSCEEIMTTLYKPIEFAVDGLLAQGLYILAGSPKAGKSWLALTRPP